MKVYYPKRSVAFILILLSILHFIVLNIDVYNNNETTFFYINLFFEVMLIITSLIFFFRKAQEVQLHKDCLIVKNAFMKPIIWKWNEIKIVVPKRKIKKLIPISQVGKLDESGVVKVITFVGYKHELMEEISNRAINAEVC